MLINSTDKTVSDGGSRLPADRRCNGIEEKSEILKFVGDESAHSCSLAFPIQRLLNVPSGCCHSPVDHVYLRHIEIERHDIDIADSGF